MSRILYWFFLHYEYIRAGKIKNCFLMVQEGSAFSLLCLRTVFYTNVYTRIHSLPVFVTDSWGNRRFPLWCFAARTREEEDEKEEEASLVGSGVMRPMNRCMGTGCGDRPHQRRIRFVYFTRRYSLFIVYFTTCPTWCLLKQRCKKNPSFIVEFFN